MPLVSGKTMGYIALRLLLATATGGASEAAMIGADIMGAAFAAADFFEAAEALVSSAPTFEGAVEEALKDGRLTWQEAQELTKHAVEICTDVGELKEAHDHLKEELKANKTLTGEKVMRVARKVHCSVCGAEGVNKASHRRGHARAGKHNF